MASLIPHDPGMSALLNTRSLRNHLKSSPKVCRKSFDMEAEGELL